MRIPDRLQRPNNWLQTCCPALPLLESDHAESDFSENDHVSRHLAWALEYHRREAKPQWWKYFSRASQSYEELFDDSESLAGLKRTTSPSVQIKQSTECEYSFDPSQESKVVPEKRYHMAEDVSETVSVTSVDYDQGLIRVKRATKRGNLPGSFDLVPGGPVATKSIVASIGNSSEAWYHEANIQPAIRGFILRDHPKITGLTPGEHIVGDSESLVDGTIRAVSNLNESVLCIQGPPGCGKTHVSAHAIIDLIKNGKRVGVSSNSHKAIINLLNKVSEIAQDKGASVSGIKIGPGEGLDSEPAYRVIRSASGWDPTENSELLVGATAWAFSREDWREQFDYLFIDEAGQVSMANLIAMAPATKNIVIIGDQMQLEQPLQGTHPGSSGLSIMEYFLNGHATIPPEMGILLDTSWPDAPAYMSVHFRWRVRGAPQERTTLPQACGSQSAGRRKTSSIARPELSTCRLITRETPNRVRKKLQLLFAL